MERDSKIAVVVIAVIIIAMVLYFVLSSPPEESSGNEWEPDISDFSSEKSIVRNETGFIVYANVSYNHTVYEEYMSHYCNNLRFRYYIVLANGSSGYNWTESKMMGEVVEEYKGVFEIWLFFLDPREPVFVDVVDVARVE